VAKRESTTVGRLLLNDVLPSSHPITGSINKKELNALLGDLARHDPQRYVTAISSLKRVGDAVATDEGITIGLDDITPHPERDSVLEPYLARVKATKDPALRIKLIEEAQKKILGLSKTHPGSAALMASSGSRGNLAQVTRVIGSPIAVLDDRENVMPWIISKSYAEGLKAPDNWISIGEARRGVVTSNISVAEPGEISKLLVNNMGDQLITVLDCGTTNGVAMAADDPHVQDRYLAKSAHGIAAGTLLTGQVVSKAHHQTLVVRSPMTCEAPHGVCQKCYGLNTRGQAPRLGENVGMIAAQAMGEPLTQMALSAKHATGTAGKKVGLSGLTGLRQITEIPQSFFNKATLADHAGTITSVNVAPQGGHYVHVGKDEHYVPPTLDVIVHPGDKVDAGDALSDGIPKPDEVVRHKGLGVGRAYLVDQLHNVYRNSGIDMDKRHFELLAKTDLNYVRIMDKDAEQLGLMRGDVVDYNRFRAAIAHQTRQQPLKDSAGDTLGDNVLHYTAGTRITPTVIADLQRAGIKQVTVAPRIPVHEPLMKPISRAPLLRPDWLARLGHRNLKTTILEGAAFGESADLHGTHPIPGFVLGEEFGQGVAGQY
jgi:DNA-directed RNA polymerase subunit beta'